MSKETQSQQRPLVSIEEQKLSGQSNRDFIKIDDLGVLDMSEEKHSQERPLVSIEDGERQKEEEMMLLEQQQAMMLMERERRFEQEEQMRLWQQLWAISITEEQKKQEQKEESAIGNMGKNDPTRPPYFEMESSVTESLFLQSVRDAASNGDQRRRELLTKMSEEIREWSSNAQERMDVLQKLILEKSTENRSDAGKPRPLYLEVANSLVANSFTRQVSKQREKTPSTSLQI